MFTLQAERKIEGGEEGFIGCVCVGSPSQEATDDDSTVNGRTVVFATKDLYPDAATAMAAAEQGFAAALASDLRQKGYSR